MDCFLSVHQITWIITCRYARLLETVSIDTASVTLAIFVFLSFLSVDEN